MPTPGRNDPCPCGSGKKYKKCCLSKERAGRIQAGSLHVVQDLIVSPRKRERVVEEHRPMMETIERVVCARYRHDPALTGQDIIGVYNSLLGVLTRRVDEGQARASYASLAPRAQPVHDALKETILNLDGLFHPSEDDDDAMASEGETGTGTNDVPTTRNVVSKRGAPVVRDCLAVLIDSARFWTRKGGSRGYLEYISRFF